MDYINLISLLILIYSFLFLTQTMLSLINDRLTRNVFDDVMEVAWSTMWNVTDETAINCKRFLDGNGMEYFLGCLRVSFEFFLLLYLPCPKSLFIKKKLYSASRRRMSCCGI